MQLEPTATDVPILNIVSENADVQRLIQEALASRPETDQADALVAAADHDLRAARYALFIPSVSLGYSTSQFGGGPGTSIQDTSRRDDLTLLLYWPFDHFGLANRARIEGKEAALRRRGLERDKLDDAIAAEVESDYARVQSLRQQIQLTADAVTRASDAYGLNRTRIYDRQPARLAAAESARPPIACGQESGEISALDHRGAVFRLISDSRATVVLRNRRRRTKESAMKLTDIEFSRRELMRIAAAGGVIASGQLLVPAALAQQQDTSRERDAERGEKEVGATEDLMREHGVLRRTLIVYSESSARLRKEPAGVAAPALADAARLFRQFGEQYHERMLEEQYIFPVVRKVGRDEAALVDVLVEQHRRGREITDYIVSVTRNGRIAASQAVPLASALDSMVRMYRPHAAREDTVVFPAWKAALPQDRLDELGERFEDIEHEQFGKDGFDDAVKRIAGIEQTLGLADLAEFTAPPPPASGV